MDEIINREENLPIFIEELRDMIFDVGNLLTLPSHGVVKGYSRILSQQFNVPY